MSTYTDPWHRERLALEGPADVEYHPAPSWSLTIQAPARTLREPGVGDGRIEVKPHTRFCLLPCCISFGTPLEHTVDVSISGPALREIRGDGSADLQLDQVRQDRRALEINGRAKVRGSGTVHVLAVVIEGSGTARLGHMSEQRARVRIDVSGAISIALTETACRCTSPGPVPCVCAPIRCT